MYIDLCRNKLIQEIRILYYLKIVIYIKEIHFICKRHCYSIFYKENKILLEDGNKLRGRNQPLNHHSISNFKNIVIRCSGVSLHFGIKHILLGYANMYRG